jgi:hypothetical protein
MISRLARHYGMILALLAVPCPMSAQKPSAIPLVPAANWRLSEVRKLDLNAVGRWGGNPTVDREYGVRSVEHRIYALRDQQVEVIVEETPDPSSAYGLLTFYQAETAAPLAGRPPTLVEPVGVVMSRGRFFIRVIRPDNLQVSDSEFRALLVFIGGTWASGRRPPHLPMAMPERDLVPGSEKYILGPEAARRVLASFRTDLIGFAQGAEVQAGTYRSGGQRLTMLAISYPTPQIARVRYGAMESFLGFNQDRGSDSIFARRSGSFVFVVLGSPAADRANKLMNQLQVTGHISWDERPPRSKPLAKELLELIVANLLLITILAGGSIGGGILFFAWKRMVAHWFPKWTWANPDQDTIIKLNLS